MTTAANDDPLAGWDPRRRAALVSLWQAFKDAGGDEVSLSDELIAERRLEAAAEDGIGVTDSMPVERRPEPPSARFDSDRRLASDSPSTRAR
jgi:hypothetical protein